MSLLPNTISKQDSQDLLNLAARIFNVATTDLTKSQVMYMIQMDMATVISSVTVSGSITRPTEIKFATNNYYTSMTLSLEDIKKVNTTLLEGMEMDKIIPTYLEMKRAMYGFISAKHESMENYIRSLLETAAGKDSCPKTGRFNN